MKLVERVLNAAGADAGATSDAAREQIEQLVEAVHRHARTLALLAPALRSRGVEATRESLVELMAQMEKDFPGKKLVGIDMDRHFSQHRGKGCCPAGHRGLAFRFLQHPRFNAYLGNRTGRLEIETRFPHPVDPCCRLH